MSDEFITKADRQLQSAYEGPMSLSEYVDAAFESPSIAAHASRYLLAAIESMDTRTVIEEGQKRERYRFFDDPHNDGEHAVLGNTAVLNAFVDDLRTIAANRGKGEKIIWFDGPTATGKSELKRCLVNGLREYSKTPEGRRYTLEWNITGAENSRGLSYGDDASDDEQWYESPVQVHPLTIFPKSVRDELLAQLNEADSDGPPIVIDGELDPFSREAYEYLETRYRQASTRKLFSSITDKSHLRVTNYVVDVGQGIGVLHSEDDGSPKERLVGSWMPGMLRELDSRGRKNPQAFSYDGVLSQGNSLLTVVEDASQHADLLRKLLNVPDEGRVKLDKGIGMDIDTQLIMISNPDLDAELDQYADRNGQDPLKALKRRLDRHEFRYLTNRRLEAELIRRELTAEKRVWADLADDEIESRVQAPLSVSVRDGRGETRKRELAPFAIGAAAMYSVISRLDGDDLPSELTLIEKARLFEQGYLQDGDERLEIEDFEFDLESDGTHGIPVTFTRDIIADLLHDETGRGPPRPPRRERGDARRRAQRDGRIVVDGPRLFAGRSRRVRKPPAGGQRLRARPTGDGRLAGVARRQKRLDRNGRRVRRTRLRLGGRRPNRDRTRTGRSRSTVDEGLRDRTSRAVRFERLQRQHAVDGRRDVPPREGYHRAQPVCVGTPRRRVFDR